MMPDNFHQSGYNSNSWLARAFNKGQLVLVAFLWVLAGICVYIQIRNEINVLSIVVIVLLLAFATGMSFYIRNVQNELERVLREIEQAASTDELTQLFNRKYFLTLFEKELGRAIRHDRKICCFIVDIDHFKSINDQYGAEFGDNVIHNVADILRDNLRIGDLIGRYESNKFICALPETDLQSSMILSKRMRSLVEGTNFSDDKTGETISITISIGVSCWEPGRDRETDIGRMINVAEQALATAKEGGRNRVESSLV